MKRFTSRRLLATVALTLSSCGPIQPPAARPTATATTATPEAAFAGSDSKTSPRFALVGGTYKITWGADEGDRLVGEVILRGGDDEAQVSMPIVALVTRPGVQTLVLPAGHYAADVVLMTPARWTFTITREAR